jgi:hypothetical protein
MGYIAGNLILVIGQIIRPLSIALHSQYLVWLMWKDILKVVVCLDFHTDWT